MNLDKLKELNELNRNLLAEISVEMERLGIPHWDLETSLRSEAYGGNSIISLDDAMKLFETARKISSQSE